MYIEYIPYYIISNGIMEKDIQFLEFQTLGFQCSFWDMESL
jgi:hypothetical protein